MSNNPRKNNIHKKKIKPKKNSSYDYYNGRGIYFVFGRPCDLLELGFDLFQKQKKNVYTISFFDSFIILTSDKIDLLSQYILEELFKTKKIMKGEN